jgi:hypothetical protein
MRKYVTVWLAAAGFFFPFGAFGLSSWEEIASNREMPVEAHKANLDAFVWPISINKDQEPTVYIRSSTQFRLRVFRLGWYAGAGVDTIFDSGTELPPRNMGVLCGAESSNTQIASEQKDFGLVECPWTDPFPVPVSSLSSGLYVAVVTATIDGTERNNMAPFVVRDDGSSNRIVIVNPTTWQAYTIWSDTPDADYQETGYTPLSLYPNETRDGSKLWPRATKVSFNRPIQTFDILKTDYPLIRFLEREGIPYTVATDYDLDTNQSLLDSRKSAIISGHGEYWSHRTRNNFIKFH